MKTILDIEGTVDSLKEAVGTLQKDSGINGLMIFTCYKNGFTPETLDPVLKDISLPLFGGCFPGILHQDQLYEKGTVVLGLPISPQIHLIEDLKIDQDNFDELIDSVMFKNINSGTMVILIDGMFLRVNSILESVFNEIGNDVNYIGGGASSMDFNGTPCLFTNSGFKQNCAVLAYLPLKSGVGISHGMKSVEGPYKITGGSLNTIKTIEWEPAAKFYKKIIESHPDYDKKRVSLIGTDAHYSLGLNRFESERIILEPAKLGSDKSLTFMQEIHEGEFVDIMHITDDSMIKSAANSLEQATNSLNERKNPETIISFDCVSRKLFLGERFKEELQTLNRTEIIHVGALTVGGEIGCKGTDFLDYHNRTLVIGAFGR